GARGELVGAVAFGGAARAEEQVGGVGGVVTVVGEVVEVGDEDGFDAGVDEGFDQRGEDVGGVAFTGGGEGFVGQQQRARGEVVDDGAHADEFVDQFAVGHG